MRDGSDERVEGEDEGVEGQDAAPGRVEKALVPILGSLGINFSISFLCMFIPWGVVDAKGVGELVRAVPPPVEEPVPLEPELDVLEDLRRIEDVRRIED